MKKQLLATLGLIIGIACAAQGTSGDTLALFDFNNPNSTVVTGTGTVQGQTSFASSWHRISGQSYLNRVLVFL